MLTSDRILITGAYGFLGGHVSQEFRSRGYGNLVEHRGSMHVDFRSPYETQTYLASRQPDVVVHLAARVGGIGANQKNPGVFFYDNMMMGMNLIEASRLNGVKKFVMLGTVCSYPKFTPVPFVESELWNGYPEETNAPYGIAKKSLMEMLNAYRKEYNFNGITLFPVNMYGPGDEFDPEKSHVIPAIILKVHDAIKAGSEEVHLWGTGRATREFLYVKDCAEAVVNATLNYDKPDPVNIGTGKEISIRELADTIGRLMGFRGEFIYDTSKPDGQPRRCLSVSKAKAEFDFEAHTDLESGLKETIKWFNNNFAY